MKSDLTNELIATHSTAIRMTAPDPIVDEVQLILQTPSTH